MRAAVRLVGGLRPAVLAVLGLGWAWYGYSITADPGYARARGLAGITRYVPLTTLGWVWVAAGAVAVAAALVRHWRIRWQAAGFAALAGPPLLWGITYARAAIDGTGSESAPGSAGAWLAFAVAIVLVAGLAEPVWVVETLYERGEPRD